jgi:hypothetical protein
MTLHEAIIQVLQQKGSTMTAQEITDELNLTGLYKRSDGTDVCTFQVHSRTFNKKDLFIQEGNIIKLKEI